jgi:hypothetical protein
MREKSQVARVRQYSEERKSIKNYKRSSTGAEKQTYQNNSRFFNRNSCKSQEGME